MPETSENPDQGDRIAARSDGLKEAWAATLDDMDALAAEYEADGWETLTIPAGHTSTEAPESGDEERFGLVYVIPDNYAEEFSDVFDDGEFPRYDVFRNESHGQVFLVTLLADPESETAVFVAGGFERRGSRPLMGAASDAGTMYTHLQTLDGTQLGSFEHDDPEKFFPATDYDAVR
ncbi:hypothetical protein C448_08864 [Halococcus morrhuae DSM 1307]|uniref:Uncharacterized protein n=1 Tax=Halococcus morrhuae DSM 1307 TaxID=931277 RepID=M0MF46_HALMO|nr:hypothetical protein [Halococcus morrhuae]EMA44372.1 hypothetical protein C448_08864 [Halococcus morrhuae DSM 1307]